jgi:hypothetical protein
MPPGNVSHAVEHDGVWYAFAGLLRGPEVTPFEQVREQVTARYRLEKEQEQIAALIDSTLAARNVKLYPERIPGNAAAP